MQMNPHLPTQAPENVDLIATAVTNSRLLAIVGGIGAIIALIFGAMLGNKYEAKAQMLVDPRDLLILDEQVTPNSEAETVTGAIVESQALVFTSRVVLNSVIDKLRLDENPDFNGEGSAGILDSFASLASTELTPEQIEADLTAKRSAAIEELQKIINVQRIENSFVLEITARADSRQLAQAIVQTVVSSYLQDLLRSRAEVAQRASEDIAAGMQLLRDRVHAIERETANYIARHDLFEMREELMLNANLATLTEELVSARVDTARLKAQLDQASEDFESLASLPEALDSLAISNLRAAQAEIAAEKAEQTASFGANSATMRALNEQAGALDVLIRTELERIYRGLSISYARAVQHEADLEEKVEELRNEIETANLAQIQLRELTRELEASRTIYNAALTRERQAREQARVNTANVRVISPATAAKERVFPPPLPMIAAFGFMAAALSAFLLLHIQNLARAHRI